MGENKQHILGINTQFEDINYPGLVCESFRSAISFLDYDTVIIDPPIQVLVLKNSLIWLKRPVADLSYMLAKTHVQEETARKFKRSVVNNS